MESWTRPARTRSCATPATTCVCKTAPHAGTLRSLRQPIGPRFHEPHPCKGGNGRPDNYRGDYVHQLELLADLNNADKHQTLTEIVLAPHQMTIMPPIAFGLGDVERPDFIHRWGPGTEVLRVRAPFWPREGQTNVGSARPTVLLEVAARPYRRCSGSTCRSLTSWGSSTPFDAAPIR
jgi:hypothetical protein